MISRSTYICLYILWGVVIGYGMFLPLMENDSAQHATMAMTMAQSHDYLTIIKGGADYLDKPHMHFWLAAFSFEIFGLEVWAYRLPAILLTIWAGFAIYQLSKLLFKQKDIAKLSTLFFLTSQAIILSLHDVRTDAVLTAFVILAIWKWTKFLKKRSMVAAILGGIFTAAAYSTKGLIAIAVIGAFLFFLVLYKSYWKRLWSYKLLAGIVSFGAASVPMFIAYYHQFGIEGIQFITYEQVTGRYSGEDFGGASSNDYAFYFHTILWAILPWSLWFYFGVYNILNNVRRYKNLESLALISSIGLFVIVMNFSEFKLPHYLNIIIPLISIFCAYEIVQLYNSNKTKVIYILQITQYIITIIGLGLLLLLAFIAFPVNQVSVIITLLLAISLVVLLLYRSANIMERMVILSAGFILIANIYLNSTFYPQLLGYQSGTQLGKIVQEEEISPSDLYMVDGQYSWAMDWYIQGTTQKVKRSDLPENKAYWVFLNNIHPNELLPPNYQIKKAYKSQDYRITRLTYDFLNPATRAKKLNQSWLVQYEPIK